MPLFFLLCTPSQLPSTVMPVSIHNTHTKQFCYNLSKTIPLVSSSVIFPLWLLTHPNLYKLGFCIHTSELRQAFLYATFLYTTLKIFHLLDLSAHFQFLPF